MNTNRLVVIGNGMATDRLLAELLGSAAGNDQITVIGAEPHGSYNRILLSPLLAGEQSLDDILHHDAEWYASQRITMHSHCCIEHIDLKQRRLSSSDGRLFDYDRLVIATGSRPYRLPVTGADLPGVMTFRTIADVEQMLNTAKTCRRAVVIGGGLLGLEAANGLHLQGMEVTVVHNSDCLMDRQLDSQAAALLQHSLQQRGLRFLMGKRTAAFSGTERVERVHFADGSELAAELVVMAVGIRPNSALAKDSGLDCERGICVNDAMQTSDPAVFAIGECVQHQGLTYGLVAPVYEMSRVCAAQLNGDRTAAFQQMEPPTMLKVTGIDVFSMGDFHGGEHTREVLLSAPAEGVYRKLVLREDRLVGALLYGDTSHSGTYIDLIRNQNILAQQHDLLMFAPENLLRETPLQTRSAA